MKYRVVVSTPAWRLNGVSIHAVNLIRGLHAAGVESHVLLTRPHLRDGLAPLDLPDDIPRQTLPVAANADWPSRWQSMIDYLEGQAPCILLPNYDWSHSCVSPKLSPEIAVVGIIHSDDPVRWYRPIARMVPFWNAFVAVSNKVRRELCTLYPEIEERLSVIPYGVEIPAHQPVRTPKSSDPLRLVYAGRLAAEQKRVFDLVQIMDAVLERQGSAILSIVGGGPDEAQLRERSEHLVSRGAIRFLGIQENRAVLRAFEEADVLLLTSEYEGLPVTLLEAMGRGCIPVVTDIESGIPEMVQNGVNGYRVPVGDVHGFAKRVLTLEKQPDLRRRMAAAAFDTVSQGRCRINDMTDRYVELFGRVMDHARTGRFRRPFGEIVPPQSLAAAMAGPRNGSVVRKLRGVARRILRQ